jgi:cathepsin D
MSFGGKSWSISSKDMNIGAEKNDNTRCVGAIFDLEAGTSITPSDGNPGWVVGDTFLKNVYSVFRTDPPSVGFAELSTIAGGTGAPNADSVPSTTSTTSAGQSGTNTSSAAITAIAPTFISVLAVLISAVLFNSL